MGPKPKSHSTLDATKFGLTKGDFHQFQTAPPPVYPPLSQKPVVTTVTDDLCAMCDIYDRVRCEIREDAFHITLPEEKSHIESYSDQMDVEPAKKYNYNLQLFPSVLTTKIKRKRVVTKDKVVNLDKVLSEDREKDGEKPEDEKGEDEEEEVVAEENDEDNEEMDDDYADNYFDNGENFLDPEDDALEEGAVF